MSRKPRSAPRNPAAPLRVTDWPLGERPRERLFRFGPAALSDAELLAVVLRTGGAGADVLTLARRLILRQGGLREVIDAAPRTLLSFGGLGPAKAAAIAAVRELLERYHAQTLEAGVVLGSAGATRRLLSQRLARLGREVFGAIFLDSRHRLLAMEELFAGSVDRAAVYPREVVKASLGHNASALILYHNHPSGVPEPSASDVQLTDRLRTLLREIDVVLLDHVIVGRGGEVSMAERGLI